MWWKTKRRRRRMIWMGCMLRCGIPRDDYRASNRVMDYIQALGFLIMDDYNGNMIRCLLGLYADRSNSAVFLYSLPCHRYNETKANKHVKSLSCLMMRDATQSPLLVFQHSLPCPSTVFEPTSPVVRHRLFDQLKPQPMPPTAIPP